MLQGILIIVLFLIVAGMMITKKMPTLLALPLLAVGIAIIARVPMVGVDADGAAVGFLQTILEAGSTRMAGAYIAVVFGAWLGQMMNKSGVTENMIKKAAELGGDRPFIVTIVLSVVVALLFTTLAGLGSVIMVGTIVLPILVSIGVPALTAVSIFLMAFTSGLTFNLANWQTYTSIFELPIESIRQFSGYLLIATSIATLVLIIVEFKRNGIKFSFSAPNTETEAVGQLKGFSGLMAMLTPALPIILVVVFNVPVVPSFFAGIIWIAIFTYKGWNKTMNLITKACYDGFSDAAPAVILMVGIGMLYLSVTNPIVKDVLQPFMLTIIPSTKLPYILFFIVLAPFALYRGPLNLFGLGSGIAALIIGLEILPSLAVMGAFLAVERVQAGGDPTNTHNVWAANFVGVEVNVITKKLLPYLWLVTAIGVVISAVLYF
ncbi:MAG: C4-dicarboxylate ABC transporter [Erysipelothrix sp.]|nr:C4-dicarboxylate ABC transporter [Erysipelothrix sp.]